VTSNHRPGFEGFQSRLDAMVEALGGHHFARVAVAQDMADRLRRLVDSRLGYEATCGLTFSEYLLATAGEFDAAAATTEKIVYREHAEPADAVSAPIHGGTIALRDTRLWFETDRAALLLAHAYEDPHHHHRKGGKARWGVGLTDEAKAYFYHAGGKEPAQSSTSAGSRDGALKSLRRLAETAFGAPLTDQVKVAA